MKLTATLLFGVISTFAGGQTCDCTVYPFKPDACYKVCTGKLLKGSNALELALILGISESTAKAVTTVDSSKIRNLDDYQQYLTGKEFAEVTSGLHGLNKIRVDYFINSSVQDRGKMLFIMKEALGPRSRIK